MFRTLAAILLVSSASASAQSYAGCRGPKAAARDLARPRRRCALPRTRASTLAECNWCSRGDKLLFLSGGDPGSELSYTVDPAKESQANRSLADSPESGRGPKSRRVQRQLIFRGIYAFEQHRLSLRIDQGVRDRRRPIDFSVKARSGDWDWVFILERDTSPAGRHKSPRRPSDFGDSGTGRRSVFR